MKMVPFPEHLDPVAESQVMEHLIIDSENYVVCADDGTSFQVTIEGHPGERVADCEVAWDEEAKAWRVI